MLNRTMMATRAVNARLAALVMALCLVPAGACRGPSGKEPASRIGAGGLGGDVRVGLTRTWGRGKRVEIDVKREGGEVTCSVRSVWLKSSLMPERLFDVEIEAGLLREALGDLEAADLGAAAEDDERSPWCSVEVQSGGRAWRWSGPLSSTGGASSPCEGLAGRLHPRWFLAHHLHEAGEDAESRLDARDVYHYYADGLAMLGEDYGVVESDHTVGQVLDAAAAHREERYVDAVVLARNALDTRLRLYAASHLGRLSVTR